MQALEGLLKLWPMLGELTVPTVSCLVFLTVAGNSLPSFFRFFFKTTVAVFCLFGKQYFNFVMLW